MEFILIALIVVVVIAFVAYPLVNAPEEPAAEMNSALDSLIAQRDSAYDAIRDLDFDYQMGKLSRSDYELLRDKYKARAAEALRQIDQVAGAPETDADIEAQVTRLRRRRRPAATAAAPEGAATALGEGQPVPAGDAPSREDEIEAQVGRLRARQAQARGNDDIEAQVAQLRKHAQPGVPRCPQCKASLDPGDLFCPRCGTKLPSNPAHGLE